MIELLVVVAVIAILAAMLLPSLARGKAQALNTACKNNLHQMGLGLQMYANANNDSFPSFFQPNTDQSENVGWWYGLLAVYDLMSPTNASSHCPVYVQNRGIFDPEQTGMIDFGSYGINTTGTSSAESRSRLGLAPVHTGWPTALESQVAAPVEMFAIGDAREFSVPPGDSAIADTPSVKNGFSFGVTWLNPFIEDDVAAFGGSMAYTNEFAPSHAQGYNVLHVDGHVALVTRRNMYYPPVAAPRWNIDNQPHQETWVPQAQWAVQQ